VEKIAKKKTGGGGKIYKRIGDAPKGSMKDENNLSDRKGIKKISRERRESDEERGVG